MMLSSCEEGGSAGFLLAGKVTVPHPEQPTQNIPPGFVWKEIQICSQMELIKSGTRNWLNIEMIDK